MDTNKIFKRVLSADYADAADFIFGKEISAQSAQSADDFQFAKSKSEQLMK